MADTTTQSSANLSGKFNEDESSHPEELLDVNEHPRFEKYIACVERKEKLMANIESTLSNFSTGLVKVIDTINTELVEVIETEGEAIDKKLNLMRELISKNMKSEGKLEETKQFLSRLQLN